jgi:hypothetical protein
VIVSVEKRFEPRDLGSYAISPAAHDNLFIAGSSRLHQSVMNWFNRISPS